MLDYEEIFLDPPLVHLGGNHLWTIDPDVLRFIIKVLPSNSETLETGLGLSTLIFSRIGISHTCVVPDSAEVSRLREYCRIKSIDISNITFHVGFSQNVLPSLQQVQFDCVLIDGGHGFPIPFIDYAYTTDMIKLGGILIVDDCQIWTGNVLAGFLLKNSSWELIKQFPRTAIFRKIGADHLREWNENPYDIYKSRRPILRYKCGRAIDLLVSGRFLELFSKLLGRN